MSTPAVLSRLSTNTFRKLSFPKNNNNHPNVNYPQYSLLPTTPTLKSQTLLESDLISLLHGCTNLTNLKQVHAHIYRHGFEQNCYIITKLIRTLTKLDSPMGNYPFRVFNQVNNPNSFLWTAFIRGYVLNGLFSESFALYSRMRKEGDVKVVSFTFSALLKGCSVTGRVDLGKGIHGQMFKFGGFLLDLHLGNSLIDTYVKCGDLKSARKVFDEMPERDIISGTSLIVAYAKEGDVEYAKDLFDEIPVKDAIVWTALITAYVQNAKPKEGLELFEKMQSFGVEPDEFTLVGVISACAQLGTTKYATWIRDVAAKSGNAPEKNVIIGSALVDMYAKCGRVEDAFEIFKVMIEKNVYTYSSMILGFAVHGHFDAAMQLFYEMETVDVKPNRVTFVGVLTACSHAGKVEEGRRLFGIMEEHYGVTPTSDHYTCMVDLLGRSGHLEEALGLIRSMPLDPHGGVWGALLGACSVHKNPDIAEIAASYLFKLEPDSIGNYVVLCNILASAGRWDSVSRVRKLMRKKGLQKNPACSWVEVKKGNIHEFFAGDLTHPRSQEIKQVLEELLGKLTLHGYQPNLGSVSYDIGDEDKRQLLMTHSEKLALAFGLLTVDSKNTIRIMKNLRICEDCHIFMCGASKITKREIVVRDNMRFHHFIDGACSCGNFW